MCAAGLHCKGSRRRYNAAMVTRGIREFVARDWQAARAGKDAYWAERIARLGPGEGFRIAEELRRQMLQSEPNWPDAAARRADILSHARVAALMNRACPPRRR
jgi:hypothetical protein